MRSIVWQSYNLDNHWSIEWAFTTSTTAAATITTTTTIITTTTTHIEGKKIINI